MARIAGVDIPRNKRVEVSLTYIFGIGRSTSNKILGATGIDRDTKVKDLTEEQVAKLRAAVEEYKIEGELRKEIRLNIKRLLDIKSYRGLRHRNGLPVRGQKTKTNARTRKVVIWKSGGTSGFKGTKKGTPFAAQIAAEQAAQVAIENGMKQIEIKIKGPGSGREASIRSIQATGLEVTRIVDITPVPHNGARPPKKRRP